MKRIWLDQYGVARDGENIGYITENLEFLPVFTWREGLQNPRLLHEIEANGWRHLKPSRVFDESTATLNDLFIHHVNTRACSYQGMRNRQRRISIENFINTDFRQTIGFLFLNEWDDKVSEFNAATSNSEMKQIFNFEVDEKNDLAFYVLFEYAEYLRSLKQATRTDIF